MKSLVAVTLSIFLLLTGCVVRIDNAKNEKENEDKVKVGENIVVSIEEGYIQESITWGDFVAGWNDRVKDVELTIDTNITAPEHITGVDDTPNREHYFIFLKKGLMLSFVINSENNEITALSFTGKLKDYNSARDSFRHATKVLHKGMSNEDWEEIMEGIGAYGSWTNEYGIVTYNKFDSEYKRDINKDTDTVLFEVITANH